MGRLLTKKILPKVKKMSKRIFNKVAQRSERVIVTRAVVLYRCQEGGLEFQRLIDINTTLLKGDTLTLEFKFSDFKQQHD